MKKVTALIIASLATCTAAANCSGNPINTRTSQYKAEYKNISFSRSIAPPDGQLVAFLPELKSRASSGDAEAAAAIYAGLSACASYKSVGSKEGMTSYCRDITPEDIRGMGQWLALAASLGDVDAKYSYSTVGVNVVFGSAFETLKNPEDLKAYRTIARNYLDTLAAQCNVDALSSIIRNSSNNGLIYGNSPGLAYKYQVALNFLSVDPDIAKEHLLEARIDPLQTFSLRSDAASFVSDHCR